MNELLGAFRQSARSLATITPMNIRYTQAKTILTPQKRGFLTSGARPYTHSLSWATGCGYGKLYCGAYCYAQMLPNWRFGRREGEAWGGALIIKQNAAELLAAQLNRARNRRDMRIFMSPVTDPYQPIERKLRLTRRCLEVFAGYDDLDLLLIQTRSRHVIDDLALIGAIPYAWLGMTIETDRGDLTYGPTKSHVEKRLEIAKRAVEAGLSVQIAVSPCLPYSDAFAERLLATGAQRIVIDTFAVGDGSRGARTGKSPFAALADYDWRDDEIAISLRHQLSAHHDNVEWSGGGFRRHPRPVHANKRRAISSIAKSSSASNSRARPRDWPGPPLSRRFSSMPFNSSILAWAARLNRASSR